VESCQASRLVFALIFLFLPLSAIGEVLVVSRNTNSVVVFDDSGSFVSSVALPASASEPRDIAQAPNGDVFVLRSDATVLRFDSSFNFVESWSASGQYYGINVDDAGLVYTAGSGSASVGVYDASGNLQMSLTPSGGSNLRDTVRVGAETWISNFTGGKIDRIDAGGTDVGDIAAPSAPFGMQKAPNGDVWVVDQNSHEVRRITPAGAQAFSFDADNGPNGAISDQLRYVGVGPDGRLYVPHRDSNIVDVYDDAGTHLGTLTDENLDGPDGIVVGEITPPASSATFHVTKTFSDGNDAEVDVTLDCNSGLPLQQTYTIAGGDADGVTFVLTSIPSSGADCEVTESGGPAGYTSSGGCSWTNVTGGSHTCAISNEAADATYTVVKEWVQYGTGGDVVNAVAEVTITCNHAIDGGIEVDEDVWELSDDLGDGDTLQASVDVSTGPATCSASESIMQSGVESVADGCGSVQLSAGSSHTCTFTNTVFFEGIPTLTRYGLALMVLLMLGVGFIGMRRFV